MQIGALFKYNQFFLYPPSIIPNTFPSPMTTCQHQKDVEEDDWETRLAVGSMSYVFNGSY